MPRIVLAALAIFLFSEAATAGEGLKERRRERPWLLSSEASQHFRVRRSQKPPRLLGIIPHRAEKGWGGLGWHGSWHSYNPLWDSRKSFDGYDGQGGEWREVVEFRGGLPRRNFRRVAR